MKISNLAVLTFVFLTIACSNTRASINIGQCESSEKFEMVESRFSTNDFNLLMVQEKEKFKLIPGTRFGHSPEGKWGMMTLDGRLIHPPKWKYLDRFYEGRARFETQNSKFGFLDERGNVIIPAQFDNASRFNEGLAAVQVRGKWGYIDRSGKMVIPPTFSVARSFYSGRAFIMSTPLAYISNLPNPKARGGFINKAGKLVTEEKFYFFSEFSEGKALVNYDTNEGIQSGILDLSGKLVQLKNIAVDSSLARFRYGLAPASDTTPPSLADKIIDSIFDPFNESPKDYKVGFINQDGQFKIQPHFSNVGEFNYCVAAVKQKDQWGLIDTEGNIVMKPQFEDQPTYLGFGLVSIQKKQLVKETLLVEVMGVTRQEKVTRYKSQYGIINLQGKWIASPDKSYISVFREGMLGFEKNGKSGFMDTTGTG